MITGVIDIGSNSVRLALSADGNVIRKYLNTTGLARGRGKDGCLTAEKIEQTASAVAKFAALARAEGAQRVYAFATAAVRDSANRQIFLERVKDLASLNAEVLSGGDEALCGILGALGSGDGGVIDIGGASTEVIVKSGGQIKYSKSVKIGAVSLFEECGRDKTLLTKAINSGVGEFGRVPHAAFTGISGTATTLAALHLNLSVYDPKKIHGHIIPLGDIEGLTNRLLKLSSEQTARLSCMDVRRADVIAGGSLLLLRLLEHIGADKLAISENDNTEGYLTLKGL